MIAIMAVIISLIRKLHHIPLIPTFSPRIVASGNKMMTCLNADITRLEIPLENPCNA